MDLSAVTHAQGRRTKGKGPQKNSSKPPLKKPAHPRLAPHPDGRLKPSSPSPRTTPKQPVASGSQGRTFLCYKCNQPGHFARDCPVTLRNLDRHHIQAMESALTLIYKDMGLEDEAEEEDDDEALVDPLTSMVLEEAEEEEEAETDLSTLEQSSMKKTNKERAFSLFRRTNRYDNDGASYFYFFNRGQYFYVSHYR